MWPSISRPVLIDVPFCFEDLLFCAQQHLFSPSLLITIELWQGTLGDPHKWWFGPLSTFICFPSITLLQCVTLCYTALHCYSVAPLQKTKHADGTAVAKCLLLTATASFPSSSYFKEAPAKNHLKINIASDFKEASATKKNTSRYIQHQLKL